LAEAERLRQSLLADADEGDLLKTIIDRVELRPNGLRMILSLAPLTPAAAPPNRLQGCVFTRDFRLRIKRRGVEMRFAIDAPDPRATNPDPVLLKESSEPAAASTPWLVAASVRWPSWQVSKASAIVMRP
jgi:hypothetical protein